MADDFRAPVFNYRTRFTHTHTYHTIYYVCTRIHTRKHARSCKGLIVIGNLSENRRAKAF